MIATFPQSAPMMDVTVHISDYNSKLGRMPNSSTLPTDDYIRDAAQRIITDCKGTCDPSACKVCKKYCYAKGSVLQYENVRVAWTDNTRAARLSPSFLSDAIIQYYYHKRDAKPNAHGRYSDYFRYNVSGDIPNYDTLIEMCDLARRMQFYRRNLIMYAYTKRADLVNAYLDVYRILPRNLQIIISQDPENVLPNPYNLPEFWYDDGTDSAVMAMPHCRAVNADGSRNDALTCKRCGRCQHMRKGQKIAVAAH